MVVASTLTESDPPVTSAATPKPPKLPMAIDLDALPAPMLANRQISDGALTGRSGCTWQSGVLSPSDLAKDAAVKIKVCEAKLMVATAQLESSPPDEKLKYIENLSRCAMELESARKEHLEYLSQQRTATLEGSKTPATIFPSKRRRKETAPFFSEDNLGASAGADQPEPQLREVKEKPASSLAPQAAPAIALALPAISQMTPVSALQALPRRWDAALGNAAKLKLFEAEDLKALMLKYTEATVDRDDCFRVISVTISSMERYFVEYAGSCIGADFDLAKLNQDRFYEAATHEGADSSALRALFWHFLEGMSVLAHLQKNTLDGLRRSDLSRPVHEERLQKTVERYVIWFGHYSSMGVPLVEHEIAFNRVKNLIAQKPFDSPVLRRGAAAAAFHGPGSSTDGISLAQVETPTRRAW